MNLLESNRNEKNRILKLHLNEQTSTASSGSYETPMAFSEKGDLTTNLRGDNLVGVDLVMSLPAEVDITGGRTGGFEDVGMEVCSECGICHEGPCGGGESFHLDELLLDPDDESTDDSVIPDTLLTLFGDVNIDGDLEIELDEEPKKMRGSRKFRKY
jgi:hypothetical protein